MIDVGFALMNKDSVLPSKRDCDTGYDIYGVYNEVPFDKDIILEPGDIIKVPTGLIPCWDNRETGAFLGERGSTGSICLAVRSGVFEGSFRGQWTVMLNNTSNKNIIITDTVNDVVEKPFANYYPKKKAIAQLIFLTDKPISVKQMSYEEVMAVDSERGDGREGSSGK